MFRGSMKNLSLFGQIMNLNIMSIVNMPQITYSMIRTLGVVRVESSTVIAICTAIMNPNKIKQNV